LLKILHHFAFQHTSQLCYRIHVPASHEVVGLCRMVAFVPSLIHVLIIAHPDDESMFFLPWIYSTIHLRQKSGASSVMWLLCLTTGNYDGLGNLRSQELYNVNEMVLNNSFQKVILLDQPDVIMDHPLQRWDIAMTTQQLYVTLQNALNQEYGRNARPLAMNFITFDEGGISGHVNHIDTFKAVQLLFANRKVMSSQTDQPFLADTVTAWTLETIRNPIIKYLPIGEWIRLLLCNMGWYGTNIQQQVYKDDETNNKAYTPEMQPSTILCRLLQPTINWHAMSTHRSQFVWYRRLFVVFSIYTYQNRLRPMKQLDLTTAQATKIPATIGQQHQQGIKKEL
jgi:N-acetylglucosaminylphosphatidylinositol deacetylase